MAGFVSGDQAGDGFHYVLVFPEDQQDETAGNAGEDHGADCDGSAEEDEPESVRGLGGGEGAYCYTEDSSGNEQKYLTEMPAVDSPDDEY